VPTLLSPVHFESLSMPFDDGFRFDDEERILPLSKQVGHETEEHPVLTSEPQLRRRAQRDFKLLSNKQVFELKLGSRFEGVEEEDEQRADH